MKKLLIITIIGLMVGLTGCAKNNSVGNSTPQPTSQTTNTTQNNTSNSTSSTTDQKADQKSFTLAELSKYDGQNGNPAYVAVDGVVYDVTNAPMWRNGKHEGVTAGKDLSNVIGRSPHGKDVLKDLQVVGKLQ